MGEIADALRRARQEREAAERGEKPETPPPVEPRPERPLLETAPRAPSAPRGPVPAPARPRGEAAHIPSARSGFWQPRAVEASPPGPVTERYRHLALRVRRELEARQARSLLVTSALREEGKTVTTCNLALALASMSSGQRVLVADLDLRRPSVSRGLGIRARPGLDAVLRGEASLDEACHPTNVPNLDVLPSVSPVANAHELLATPGLSRVVAELEDRYAWVLADTPPVLLVPDVPLVVPLFGACLFVVRAGRTSRSHMEEALALLPRPKLLGIAVNEAHLPLHGDQYGYYMRPDAHDLEEDAADEDEDGRS